MAGQNTLTSIIPSDLSEQRGSYMLDANMNTLEAPTNQPIRSFAEGPVAILWDIENCPVPSDVRPEDVAGNIRMALQVHPVIRGAVVTFAAYGDFNAFPRRLREGCQRTGVKLVDVPNVRKDAADKAILVDMFLFSLDNPPPSSIMLISGDVDFAPALHILGQRGYTVILVIPSGVGVSSALSNAGKFVWDWSSISRGEGFVPTTKYLMHPRGAQADITGYFMGCHINDQMDNQNDEEAILYRGISQSYYISREFSVVSQSMSEYNGTSLLMPSGALRSHSLPSVLNEVPAGPSNSAEQNGSAWWVQPGDINGLRGQLEKLIELSGGCMPLTRVPSEYQKVFGRPLYVSEYGAFKLINLFKKLSDTIAVDGKGQKKFVYLRNRKPSPTAPPLILTWKDNCMRGKGTREECMAITAGNGSSEELSEEERVVSEEHDVRNNGQATLRTTVKCEADEPDLELFKCELQEILVSYSCRIFLGYFEAIYKLRYKKPLDCKKFGVDQLEKLFEKVADVAVLLEDPVSNQKIISASCG